MRINLKGGLRGVGGVGATAPTNPYPGTYDDINCPFSCWLLGNGLDISILGQECWPCHNICPSGTGWDTSTLTCDAAGATAAANLPAGCPGLCSSVPFYSLFNPDLCSGCAASGSSPDYTTWIIVGGILAAVFVMGMSKK